MYELTVHEQANADAFRHGDGDEVPHVIRLRPKPVLGQRAGVGGVLDNDWQLDSGLEQLLNVDWRPSEIGREDEASSVVHSTGEADAHAFTDDLRMRGAEAGDGLGHFGDECLRIAGCWPRCLSHEARVHAGEANGRHLGTQFHGENAGALDVQMEKPWPSSACDVTDGTLGDPAFLNELVDDGGDRAALKARVPGQIRARHRLVTPDEIQRDAAVDLPGGLAGRDVEVGE